MSAAAILRPAVPLDAGQVGAILSGFIDEMDWMPRIHTRAEEVAFADRLIENGWTTVAECAENGAVLGFLSRRDDEIVALYLSPAARRRGVGGKLVDAAKRRSPRLTLWCFQANRPARAFYRQAGFSEAERTDGARNDEGLPDIRFTWEGDPADV